jgi:hypothetical protein
MCDVCRVEQVIFQPLLGKAQGALTWDRDGKKIEG